MRTLVALLLATTSATALAQSDSVRAPSATFRGRIINQLDSTAVQSAEIRLLYIDSARVVKTQRGDDSLDVHFDSAGARFSATDSSGAFAIRQVRAGRYMMMIRRIGFAPLNAVLGVDTGTVVATLPMEPTSKLLSKVRVVETSVDVVKQKLDRTGFVDRSRLGISGTFITRADILRRQPQTIRELLSQYGINDAQVLLDRMPAPMSDLDGYPADLVLGIEVYRQSRPTEFNGTRGAQYQTLSGTRSLPLVVIWLFIP